MGSEVKINLFSSAFSLFWANIWGNTLFPFKVAIKFVENMGKGFRVLKN